MPIRDEVDFSLQIGVYCSLYTYGAPCLDTELFNRARQIGSDYQDAGLRKGELVIFQGSTGGGDPKGGTPCVGSSGCGEG